MYALSDRLGQEYRERVHLTVIAARTTADEDVPREGTTRIWRDHEGEFADAFGGSGRLWLMRPDGHLAYRAPVSNADDLLGYLERVLGKSGVMGGVCVVLSELGVAVIRHHA